MPKNTKKAKVPEGTVREFEWTNPQSWILMTVNNDEGQAESIGDRDGRTCRVRRGRAWAPQIFTPAVTLPDGANDGESNH
jgi:hypothetical protein